ncbi:MAG: O-antigen ligase family protein [bacterium]|nr:O-antigen ligase family protein [bacterium]
MVNFLKNYQKIMYSGLVIFAIFSTISISGQLVGSIIALLGWIMKIVYEKKINLEKNSLNLPICLFFLSIVISTLFSPYFENSADRIRSDGEKILLFFLVVIGVKEIKHSKILINILIISAGVESAYILLQYFWKIYLFNVVISKNLLTDRSLGGCLSMVIPITLCLFGILSKFDKKLLALIILIIILFLLLIVNNTRGAWVGVSLVMVILSIIEYKRFLWFFLSIFLIAYFILPFHIKSGTYIRIKSIFEKNSSNLERISFSKEALIMIKDNPILGVGPNNFKYYYCKKHNIKMENFCHKTCHNNFLNIGAEMGILGLCTFIYLLVIFYKNAINKLIEFKGSDNFWLILGIILSISSILTGGMFNYSLDCRTGYLFWFLLGIYVKMTSSNKDSSCGAREVS